MINTTEDSTVAQLVNEVRALRAEVAQLKRTVAVPKLETQLLAILENHERAIAEIRKELDAEKNFTWALNHNARGRYFELCRRCDALMMEVDALLDHAFPEYLDTMDRAEKIIGRPNLENSYYLAEEFRKPSVSSQTP
jgi:hypothetical protein